ncbi:hypothetical protein MGYG_08928 [Nannizzia gypsea CBS 118893]|uniref:Uncharacterized protein n=1 Tax=Arthroderma gypseum (strain ATCC MYA-4604 / CBS 118893) TaxID=535722 RepID=E5R0D3_ARTGP|nr:hypothetical protein MGYG_08928 [Nannizzia gypsea CBS 118893]EFQ98329.1 hypothetical protein MGYG_08928 [Nannizzia gypsea CBS 118893]
MVKLKLRLIDASVARRRRRSDERVKKGRKQSLETARGKGKTIISSFRCLSPSRRSKKKKGKKKNEEEDEEDEDEDEELRGRTRVDRPEVQLGGLPSPCLRTALFDLGPWHGALSVRLAGCGLAEFLMPARHGQTGASTEYGVWGKETSKIRAKGPPRTRIRGGAAPGIMVMHASG